MAKEFDGKIALVTGASSGIGRATALAFAEKGARVCAADVNIEGGNETVKLIEKAGGKAFFVKCDISKASDVKAMVGAVVKKFGRLDFAHNNAGIEGKTASTADCTEENWDKTIGINLKGVWLCMKFEIPVMLKQGGGAIVNTSSVAGLIGFQGIPAYVASKHGIIGLTKTAALEYSKANIRVNVVCPGVIQTPMIERFTAGNPEAEKQLIATTPMARVGQPKEIANAVVWLCSDKASYVTGHALVADGGMTVQ
ncbi:SDR family oxidoreductase [Candidatus Micrarchaeota archaeon]|nr:SDR family oxidoreductase [Candidatus Micrarchaeota archaeon]